MMINMFPKTAKPLLPEGTYVGTLKRIEFHPTQEETDKGIVPPFGPYLKFVFQVKEPQEHSGRWTSGICSIKRDPRSKLAQWLPAFGLTIKSLGDQVDENLFLNKEVRLKLEKNPNTDKVNITEMSALTDPITPTSSKAPLSFKPATPKVEAQASVPQPKLPKPVTNEDVPF
jgi:hypothetical protein